jgi:CubicO group peptidase (beta-lactamase class C family)
MNVKPTNAKVDCIFDHYAKPGSPGCALAVIKDGRVAYQQGYGLANLEHSVPVLPSTVFNVGSMAKQFTAFAIALLEAEGKLSLDDDLHKHLPEMHDFGHRITLRHLMHHTSGMRCTFPELLALAEWRDTDATTTQDVFWLLRAQRELNFPPGDEFLYANSNYILLALICERVSGQSFAGFCQDRIFGPLEMTHSCINDSLVKLIPGRASGYYDDGQGNWLNAPLTDSVIGPTNVYSSVEDLARWDENFYTGRAGGHAVIERMHQPGSLNDGTELDYAFGLTVGPAHRFRGWQVVEHGGGQGGYGSWMMRFPELHLSIVVLFNCFLWDMQDYALKVADLFVEEQAGPEMTEGGQGAPSESAGPVELNVEQLVGKTGLYYSARRAAVREIRCVEDRLQFQGYDLVPLSENMFFFEVEPQTRVEFIPGMDGTIVGMKTLSGADEYSYNRVEAASTTPAILAQYVGRYYSPELDIHWAIEAGDGFLTGKRRKYTDSKLTPVFADAFSDDWGPLMGYPTTYFVVFERDERGLVTGLRVSGTRVRNLRFVRQGAQR